MLKAVVDQDRLKNQQSFVLPHVMQGSFPALGSRTPAECAARFKLIWNLNKVFSDFMSCGIGCDSVTMVGPAVLTRYASSSCRRSATSSI